jgi:signal transduction histidine kinase
VIDLGGPPGRRVKGPLVPFVAAGVAALGLLMIGSAWRLRTTYRDEEIRNAESVAEATVEGRVDAALTDPILRGNAAAVARLDAAVRSQVLDQLVVGVELRSANGRVVYSSGPGQIGARFPLSPENEKLLSEGGRAGEDDALRDPDDAPERALHQHLLETYAVARTPSGVPLLLESYVAFSSMQGIAHSVFLTSLPVAIGALVLLELIQIPLAMSLVRRVRRAERRQDALVRSALTATDAERRRIAGDLHDGVVQELAGLSYTLTKAADTTARLGDRDLSEDLGRAGHTTRRTIQSLRNLAVDLYPPNLRAAGLATALDDLAAAGSRAGAEVHVRVDPDLHLADRTEVLVYRTAQEAIRNALRHACATTLDVTVDQVDGLAVLEVVDDGQGFTPGAADAVNEHLGLRMLHDLADDLDGHLEVASALGGGTRIRLEVPA